MKEIARAALLCLALTGCATSHVLVGTQRAPIEPEQVRIYIDPPTQFEKVAILETSSEGSFALTNQQKTNKVIARLKEEAASLGANGVLIQAIGTAQRGSVVNGFATASAYGNTAYGSGFAVAAPIMVKEGSALAIFVPDGVAAIPPGADTITTAAPVQQAYTAPAPPAAPSAPAPPVGAPCNACASLLNSYGH